MKRKTVDFGGALTKCRIEKVQEIEDAKFIQLQTELYELIIDRFSILRQKIRENPFQEQVSTQLWDISSNFATLSQDNWNLLGKSLAHDLTCDRITLSYYLEHLTGPCKRAYHHTCTVVIYFHDQILAEKTETKTDEKNEKIVFHSQ